MTTITNLAVPVSSVPSLNTAPSVNACLGLAPRRGIPCLLPELELVCGRVV